mgnify:FL=1
MQILFKQYKIFPIILLFLTGNIYAQNLETFVEYGATVHAGDHTPLWQVSNQQGLSSIKDNTYIRGGVFYNKELRSWKAKAGIDIAVATGFSSTFILQQAYADIRYKWIGMWAGSREISTDLLNQQLSSGGVVWSGNARPIPQICIGILDYVHLAPKVQFKAQISYGWFTDSKYQDKHVGEKYYYARKIKYHQKSFYLRFGQPTGHWIFDIGMRMDNQFGGYALRGINNGNLGNNWKDYLNALIPRNGGEGE